MKKLKVQKKQNQDSTVVSSTTENATATVNSSGPTVNIFKVNGETVKNKVMVSGNLQRETITKVNGKITNKMEREFTPISVDLNTADILKIS